MSPTIQHDTNITTWLNKDMICDKTNLQKNQKINKLEILHVACTKMSLSNEKYLTKSF